MESASAVNCCTQGMDAPPTPSPPFSRFPFFAVDAPPSCVALFVQVTQLKGDLRGEGPFVVPGAAA